MARYNIANGAIPNAPLTVIADTQGKVKGLKIQNPSGVDFWVSDDPTTLQNVSNVGLPVVGIHFWPDTAPGFVLTYERFKGKLYARAQNTGAQAEVNIYDICE
jgi:hypothetical protein